MSLRRTVISLVTAAAVIGVTALVARPAPAQSPERAVVADLAAAGVVAWPIAIARSGTYRLAADLVVPAGQDAIHVADGLEVTIDLNGFRIVGASRCSLADDCYAAGGTAGVRVLGSDARVTVRNGRIRGFSHAALSATAALPISGRFAAQDLRVENNGSGIRAGVLEASRLVIADNSRLGAYATQLDVSDSRFYDNGSCGLSGVQGRVHGLIAAGNAEYGFCGAIDVVLETNAAWGNGRGPALGGMPVAGSNVF